MAYVRDSRRRVQVARWAVALVLGGAIAGVGAGCGSEDERALLLTVSAERRAATIDVLVRDDASNAVVLDRKDEPVDFQNPTRDISQPGQELRLALRFAHDGSYLVHIVGRTPGTLPQVATRRFMVKGTKEDTIKLIALRGGDDDDLDTFAEQCAVQGDPTCDFLDCNDMNPSINPVAAEVCGDTIDQDCSGADQPCRDEDGDGSPFGTDCDDKDPARFPGNTEYENACNGQNPRFCGDGIDQDCSGADLPCKVDMDCDKFSPTENDCNDNDPGINPAAPEVCGDMIDQNCNGMADGKSECEKCDDDGDEFQRMDATAGCMPMAGMVDCDDHDRGFNPNVTMTMAGPPMTGCGGMEGGTTAACAALGMCDGKDNDCDGMMDEGCATVACDGDRDGFQHAGGGCNPGLVDCDDTNPLIFPGAPDKCGDAILQNCTVDTTCTTDADGDKFQAGAGGDCDDRDPLQFPGAVERCNGEDDDCDGLADEGNPMVGGGRLTAMCTDDNDGLCAMNPGACVCSRIVPQTKRETDLGRRTACPGENLTIAVSPRCFGATQPALKEQCATAIDDDCDGSVDVSVADAPTKLFEFGTRCLRNNILTPCTPGTVSGCMTGAAFAYTPFAQNARYVCTGVTVTPTTDVCNGIDDDCDGAVAPGDNDTDSDRYLACSGCPGTLPAPLMGCGDCQPGNGNVYPTRAEQCNGVDDDCAPGTPDGATQCSGGAPPDCCPSLSTCFNFTMGDLDHCGGCAPGAPPTGNVCNRTFNDTCSGGVCRCGSGASCAAGQRCMNGNCICDNLSCTTGCCTATMGGTCVTPGTAQGACGPVGGLCQACGSGQRCFNRQCVCDSTSCGSGCCTATVNGTCVPFGSQNNSMCGTGGAMCAGCLTGMGQSCNGAGQCLCGSTLCAAGCCQSNLCQTSNDQHCGIMGAMCSLPCASGQRCVGGQCICDATSCSNGCCTLAGACLLYRDQLPGACGAGGAMCAPCGSGQGCSTTTGMCTCGPATCPGCCEGTTCRAGNTIANCGQNGVTCDTCVGEVCTGTPRICTCGPATGCTGCCQGTNCVSQAFPAACGAGSVMCTNCSSLGTTVDSCGPTGCECSHNMPAHAPCPAGQVCENQGDGCT